MWASAPPVDRAAETATSEMIQRGASAVWLCTLLLWQLLHRQLLLLDAVLDAVLDAAQLDTVVCAATSFKLA
jgi:hypothetical protein